MKETKFIAENREKWRDFERTLDATRKDPDKLSELFVQVTDDLSYSRTFYPNRSVRVYLNNLGQKVFYALYKNKQPTLRGFIRFWTDDLPQIMFESRRDFALSAGLFFVAFLIGAVSTYMDADFPRVILGDDYVDMTLANIKEGDPMKVYKGDNELISALSITQNNLRVAFFTFVSGVLFMVGTVSILLYNGIMVGAFQTFFAMQDAAVFKESLLTIWIHGTLEISAIVLAGAAGLTMGRGLVFPATYTRAQSFQLSARRGVKMMLGIFPVFVAAGFIEGFVTRHTDTPDFLRILFIILSLSFVLFYYVFYPLRKAKRGFVSNLSETKMNASRNETIDFGRIKSNGEIFTETFIFYRQYFKNISTVALALAAAYTFVLTAMYGTQLPNYFSFRRWSVLYLPSWEVHGENLAQLFAYTRLPVLMLLNLLLFALPLFFTLKWLQKEQVGATTAFLRQQKNQLGTVVELAKVVTVSVLMQILVRLNGAIWLLPMLPLAILWASAMIFERKDLFSSALRVLFLLFNKIPIVIGLGLMFYLIILIFSFLSNTELTWQLLNTFGWNFADRTKVAPAFLYSALIFLFSLTFALLLPLLTAAFGLLFFSLVEVRDATALHKRIEKIGVQRRAYGLERE